jgi:hypothetical protein
MTTKNEEQSGVHEVEKQLTEAAASQPSPDAAPKEPGRLMLKEMAPSMFQTPIVQKLIYWTQAIGTTGSQKSIADGLDAGELVEEIKIRSGSNSKFSHYVEELLNGILQGRYSEDKAEFATEDFISGFQYWLLFRTEMALAQDKAEQNKQEAKDALKFLLEHKVFGDDDGEVIQHLMHGALHALPRAIIANAGAEKLSRETKRAIGQNELSGKQNFFDAWLTPPKDTGSTASGSFSGGTVTTRPSQQAPVQSPAEKAGMTGRPPTQLDETLESWENRPIKKVIFKALTWGAEEQIENAETITVEAKGKKANPFITATKPMEITDEMENCLVRIMLKGRSVVVEKVGENTLIDCDSDKPVESIVFHGKKPVRFRIGKSVFSIQIIKVEHSSSGQRAVVEAVKMASALPPALPVHGSSEAAAAVDSAAAVDAAPAPSAEPEQVKQPELPAITGTAEIPSIPPAPLTAQDAGTDSAAATPFVELPAVGLDSTAYTPVIPGTPTVAAADLPSEEPAVDALAVTAAVEIPSMPPEEVEPSDIEYIKSIAPVAAKPSGASASAGIIDVTDIAEPAAPSIAPGSPLETATSLPAVSASRVQAAGAGATTTLESKENIGFRLPAILLVDKNGLVIESRPAIDDQDRVMKIGTGPASNVVLPSGPGYTSTHVEVKFLDLKRIFINRTAAIAPGDLSVSLISDHREIGSQIVSLKEDDGFIIGAETANPLYFKASNEHLFTEEELKTAFHRRLEKLELQFAASRLDPEMLKTLEKKLIVFFNKTIPGFSDKQDAMNDVNERATALSGKIVEAKEALFKAKLAEKWHFSAEAGETAETPRPHQYWILIDRHHKDAAGKPLFHVVFPPGLTMGRDKVNTLEIQEPSAAHPSNHGVQKFECMLFMEDSQTVRMLIEKFETRKRHLKINGKIPGFREGLEGKNDEATLNITDIDNPLLEDGDDLEIGMDRYLLQKSHQFTAAALKPHVTQHLKKLMEVLQIYADRGDKDDLANAKKAVDHLLEKKFVTREQVEIARDAAKKEKEGMLRENAANEKTREAKELLLTAKSKNEAVQAFADADYERGILPYDAGNIRKALALLDDPDVRWGEGELFINKENYVRDLTACVQVRMKAYEKQIENLNARLAQPNYLMRLKAKIMKDAQEQLADEKLGLNMAIYRLEIELVSLLNTGLSGIKNKASWMDTVLTPEQAGDAQSIMAMHEMIAQVDKGLLPEPSDLEGLINMTSRKNYGDFFNYGETEKGKPMIEFICSRVVETAKKMYAEACEGRNISRNLDRIEKYIAEEFLSFQILGSSPAQFADLRDDASLIEKEKAGDASFEQLRSNVNLEIEDVLDFAAAWKKDDIALGETKEAEFKAFCNEKLAYAAELADIGEMTAYFGILAGVAARLGFKPAEFHAPHADAEKYQREAENMAGNMEIAEIIETLQAGGDLSPHPLLQLKNLIERTPAGTIKYLGMDAGQVLDDLVQERMEKMVKLAINGEENADFLEMIVEDMRQYGLEQPIKNALTVHLRKIVKEIYEDQQEPGIYRPGIQVLRDLGLGDFVQEISQQEIDALHAETMGQEMTQFGEDLREAGLQG